MKLRSLGVGTVSREAHSDWQRHRVVRFDGKFDTNIRSGDDYWTSGLGDFWGMPPASNPKAKAPAFIPSMYAAPDARCHAVQRAQGQFVALTGDIDKGNVPLDRVSGLARQLFGEGTAVFVYSTGSATLDDKRWRIIVPLEEPVSFERWDEAQEAFFGYMERHGVPMDWSLARAAQPVYLPNVPPERRGEDGEPLFYQSCVEGEAGLCL